MHSLTTEFLQSAAPEQTFLRHLQSGIEHARRKKNRRSLAVASSGQVIFRPLLLGYNGAANTGADVRVIEMLRQFNRIFGHATFDPILVAAGSDFDHAEFAKVRKLRMASYLPNFLAESSDTFSGIVACEGSMFTSTFSDSLTGTFAGGIGHAAALGHLGIGYGAEVSTMTPVLENFVEAACADALVIARNAGSFDKLKKLGIRAHIGTDPAWTFEPAMQDSQCPARKAGWNGRDPMAVLCPINPFCWPLVIDLPKARTQYIAGAYAEGQYNDISFHSWSEESARRFDTYLTELAKLVTWLKDRKYFPVLVGMQDIDKGSCARLNRILPTPLPILVRGSNSIDEITAVLHKSALIVSSRFHAAVIGMAGGVPCIGVSMDSRIDRLFSENGLGEWVMPCTSENLGELLIARACMAEKWSEALKDRYGRVMAEQIRAFGNMGIHMMNEVCDTYRNFPRSPLTASWDAYLPPLSPRIEKMMNRYG